MLASGEERADAALRGIGWREEVRVSIPEVRAFVPEGTLWTEPSVGTALAGIGRALAVRAAEILGII